MPLFRKNNDKNNEKNIPSPEETEKTAAADATADAAANAAPAENAVPEETLPDLPPVPSEEIPETAPVPTVDANPAKPRYQTPEGFEFNRYFLAERRIILENVSYEVQAPKGTQLKLNAKDTIVAQLIGQAGVKVTYNRTLSFEPEGPFTLSVSFSVMLVFNPGTRSEVDWKTIDMAEEFRKNCPQLVQAMVTKTTLLVAEITNANGSPILPIAIRP